MSLKRIVTGVRTLSDGSPIFLNSRRSWTLSFPIAMRNRDYITEDMTAIHAQIIALSHQKRRQPHGEPWRVSRLLTVRYGRNPLQVQVQRGPLAAVPEPEQPDRATEFPRR